MPQTTTPFRTGPLPLLRVLMLLGFLMAAFLCSFSAEAAQARGTVGRIFQWRPFLAPFHAVVLHFPIGFVTIAFLLETYRTFRPSDELRRVTGMVLWLSLITGVISATFGLMRASGGGYEPHMLDLHKVFGLGVPAATVLALVLQWLAYRDETRRGWTHGYRTMLTGTIALVVVAGHYGGNLTHGSKYLVENAPDFLKELLEEDLSARSGSSSVALNEKAQFYKDKVQPILVAKCFNCHGPDKQKGGYRLDRAEIALKGGESGKIAIKPGDPLESHLVRLILLPPGHDDVMPPEGKQSLKSEEIMVLIDWIRNGATFQESGSQLTATNRPVKESPISVSGQ
ncbi:MAG: hypothetical protein EXS31_17175 [Pedosphaera sp.]|nr:hypothetical protein [Pedosphaera sp.]